MNPAWAFFILATLVVVCGGALSWAGAVRRKRFYEQVIVNKNSRAEGDRP
ncbi:hypothetical protein [Pseudomonas monteilii]|nr:hypothetical protein [Pseudomonas monteilii]